jgi:hypothetical protein
MPLEAGKGRQSDYLWRQRALLQELLRVTRQQRRCLIEGEIAELEHVNQLLGDLLARQSELHETFTDLQDDPAELTLEETRVLDELRLLATELKQESRTNYLLASRGSQFAGFALALLAGGNGETSASLETDSMEGLHLMDRPA